MKFAKKLICVSLVVIICLSFVGCTAPNIDKRIVGNWISCSYGEQHTYIFKSNGTFEHYFNGRLSDGTYTCAGGVITFDFGEGYRKSERIYRVNEDKNSQYYGEMKIDYEYFRKK